MRLITWNCQGAFRKKSDLILELHPDILVIQECEHPDKYVYTSTNKRPDSQYWYGDSIHKGICIHSFNDYKIELLQIFNPIFRYIIPLRVTGHGQTFTLFAIWAMGNKDNYYARYIGQLWLAIDYYSDLLKSSAILVGDFNSNKIWDYKTRVGDHSDVVDKLGYYNIQSIYHRYFEIEQGTEKHPTFFLQRKLSKPYHIDYCFASGDFLDKVQNVAIGTFEDWSGYSDHVPMSFDFEA